MYKNTSGQKVLVYAYDKTTGLPQTGDSANITAYISKDGGVPTQTNDVSPAEINSTNMAGYYSFDVTQAETNCDLFALRAVSSTSNILLDQVIIYTNVACPSASDVRSEIDANSTQLASIVADTNELQTDWANGGRLDNILDARAAESSLSSISSSIGALNDISVSDILNTQMTESYAADGVAPTMAQSLYLIQQILGDFSISGTTLTVRRINGTTTAATFTLNDATEPTGTTRAT